MIPYPSDGKTTEPPHLNTTHPTEFFLIEPARDPATAWSSTQTKSGQLKGRPSP
jgi:hypothetical protein